jgi:hypothetical protein
MPPSSSGRRASSRAIDCSWRTPRRGSGSRSDADRWQIGPAYSIQANPAHLRWIAENLRAMPSRTDRQDWSVLLAARAFEMLIARRLGGPVSPRDVGDLVQAAWPDRFRKHHRPADGVDPADAARKLLARARAAVDDEEAARVIDDGCRTRPPTVPEIVPATTSGQAKTTSRQPTTKRKTPR